MTFVSVHFGSITVDEQSIIEFPEGLPGFEERRRFVPLQGPQQGGLVYLQSLERAELCFLALPVQVLRPEYGLLLTAEDLAALELPPDRQPAIGRDVAALAILSLAEGEEPTANLRSPVVIHMGTRRAVQAIRPDERYQCREPLRAPDEEGDAACHRRETVCS
jgi:flagellar assembly factor FliW